MAEPTATRAGIRQAIGRLARMPFYLRYSGGSTILGSTEQTTTQLAAADLTQPEDFWKAQYAWIVESSAERRITEYDVGSTAGLLSLEYALSAAAADSGVRPLTRVRGTDRVVGDDDELAGWNRVQDTRDLVVSWRLQPDRSLPVLAAGVGCRCRSQ